MPNAAHIVFLVHYFPPINSTGAKRPVALAKYFVKAGRKVTVITTRKTGADGAFLEEMPVGVTVLELRWWGQKTASVEGSRRRSEPLHAGRRTVVRKIKDLVMRVSGQLLDPRLPFALSILSPFLDREACEALAAADVVIGFSPPWPMLLAACFARVRFGKRSVLDYRDHFSECHEMPGSAIAKSIESIVDRELARRADALVTISDPMAQYYSRFNSRVSAIMNGYDADAVNEAREEAPARRDQSIVIRYLGSVSPGRVPRHLLQALAILQKEGRVSPSSLRIEYYGTHNVMQNAVTRDYPAILPLFTFNSSVPYRQALRLMAFSDYLLVSETSSKATLSAQGILTTKLFEYLGVGRPVIADIHPDTLIGRVLQKSGTHHFISESVEEFVTYMRSRQFWTPEKVAPTAFVKSLSREHQAEQYRLLLDGVCQSNRR